MSLKTNSRNSLTLGVVAISYNEERDLPGFITNLQSWVDEIVIVDDGSTDITQSLAKAAGSKVNFIVSPRKENEYFSHQRNKGIDAAQSDWLLHMDIDERVTPELAKEILTSIKNNEMDAYRFRRLNFFLHRPMKGGGWQDWNLVHLAKRDVFRFGGMFHEDCLVNAPPERIGQLKSMMWHLNDDSYLERMGKSNLYCQEQAIRLKERNFQVRWWHLLLLPMREFVKKYFVRGGYKDGVPGLLFANHSTAAMFKACALVWDEQNSVSRLEIEDILNQKWSDFGG
ncbi:glycosyltransferase family 2 protein [Pseudomonadota bacterium]